MTSDNDGLAACTLDLPLGQYYVKELKAPAGFVSVSYTHLNNDFTASAGCTGF